MRVVCISQIYILLILGQEIEVGDRVNLNVKHIRESRGDRNHIISQVKMSLVVYRK